MTATPKAQGATTMKSNLPADYFARIAKPETVEEYMPLDIVTKIDQAAARDAADRAAAERDARNHAANKAFGF